MARKEAAKNRIERGNVLFLILLAVVLFAALSYAVTGSMRGGEGKSASAETVKARAAQILQLSTLFEQTITRLRLVNGCKDTQISFENPVQSGYVNASAPSDKRCHVFDKAGGGLNWPENLAYVTVNSNYGWEFGGQYIITNVGTPDYELVMRLSIGGSSDYPETRSSSIALCEEINRNLMGQTVDILDAFPASQGDSFSGVYGAKTIVIGDEVIANAFPPGHSSACFRRSNNVGGYFFYHVLIAR